MWGAAMNSVPQTVHPQPWCHLEISEMAAVWTEQRVPPTVRQTPGRKVDPGRRCPDIASRAPPLLTLGTQVEFLILLPSFPLQAPLLLNPLYRQSRSPFISRVEKCILNVTGVVLQSLILSAEICEVLLW